MIRGKHTFLMSPFWQPREAWSHPQHRSSAKMRQARGSGRERTENTGSLIRRHALSSRPNTMVLMAIGISGRANSQNGPRVVPSMPIPSRAERRKTREDPAVAPRLLRPARRSLAEVGRITRVLGASRELLHNATAHRSGRLPSEQSPKREQHQPFSALTVHLPASGR